MELLQKRTIFSVMLLLICVLFSVFSALFGGTDRILKNKKKHINSSALSDNDGENHVSFACRNRERERFSSENANQCRIDLIRACFFPLHLKMWTVSFCSAPLKVYAIREEFLPLHRLNWTFQTFQSNQLYQSRAIPAQWPSCIARQIHS